jgi:7,8-dihydropterin-6-yl-methyl-4-(beta-D-ribofuranosyl)aminobenzene 5'-phosphate synthase
MKLTIIYDNTSIHDDLQADWGFSAIIEAYDKKILFDTGGNGEILLNNMKTLKIDPKSINDLFISHCHFDHVGGLSHFLNENSKITIHAPPSFRGVRNAKQVVYYSQPTKIFDHFYTTGELEHIEQALAVESDKGLIIVVGCSHPKMDTILNTIRIFGDIYGIIGGLHGFDNYKLFQDFTIICPTHCTQHIPEIKNRFPDAFIEGGTGKIITI